MNSLALENQLFFLLASTAACRLLLPVSMLASLLSMAFDILSSCASCRRMASISCGRTINSLIAPIISMFASSADLVSSASKELAIATFSMPGAPGTAVPLRALACGLRRPADAAAGSLVFASSTAGPG